MEFHNAELVWNYDFYIHEKALEIKQCTGIHDHSRYHVPELSIVGGCSFLCDTLHLLWRELIA